MFIDAFFFIPQSIFTPKDHFKLIKTMLTSINICKVYLQCVIVIQRVVAKHGLPSV